MAQLKKVAIIGRPNVGKSRLFNRIVQHQKSIVLPQPGITRDRITATASWLNRNFTLIDTGGVSNQNLTFQENINEQAKIAANEADLVIFMVSHLDTITLEDKYVASVLKKMKPKKVVLVVNKCENFKEDYNILSDYQKLGFGMPYMISAEHGIRVGDLLDEVVKSLSISPNDHEDQEVLKFTLIGKPNVGKSSLANAILNDDRLIVSEISGTTRDAIDCDFKYNNQKYCLIDTAGIRRSGQANKLEAEKYSVLRSKRSIERAQVILLVLDISDGIKEQDEVVGGLAFDANIPTIIVANKWDAIKHKDSNSMDQIRKEIRKRFAYLSWAPIVFLSAKEKSRIHTIFETLEKIKEQLKIKVSTTLLEEILMKAQVLNPVPNVHGQKIKLNFAVQVKGQIPTFVIFCNNPQLLHFSYARFIENQIRTAFGLDCVPITVYYKNKNTQTRKKN